ncbi:MAG: NusG domain II-containing protein [Anaerovoracaceae bacterium]|jgi:hypothetical protein
MRFYKRVDLIIIAVLIVLSLIVRLGYDHLTQDKPAKAEIYYYSQLIKTISLTTGEERDFSIKENPNVIFRLDKDGKIAFISSDCPDKVCVKTGKIHRVGEYAACLPNGIILKIVPGGDRKDNEPDIIITN